MYGLYIHIPFCIKKCFYCNFNSVVLPFSSELTPKDNKDNKIKKYLRALKKEMNKYRNFPVKSIYMGGGTPTILSSYQLYSLFEQVLLNFLVKKDIEITVEANPGTLDTQKLKSLKKVGVNRLSIGLQSFNNDLLKGIGRIHTVEEFSRNFYLARKVGFDNINIDLIFALPGQTTNVWKETLEKTIRLKPEHISLYDLTIEPGTKMYSDLESGRIKPCDKDVAADMYEDAIKILTENGYKHYEISNFALQGRDSKHNQLYWKNGQYLGIGAGATSFLNGVRFTNVEDVDEYISKVSTDEICMMKEKLVGKKKVGEKIILGLRMQKGIKIDKQIKIFFGKVIEKLISKGLLQKEKNNLRLTYKGLLLGNQVFMEFL